MTGYRADVSLACEGPSGTSVRPSLCLCAVAILLIVSTSDVGSSQSTNESLLVAVNQEDFAAAPAEGSEELLARARALVSGQKDCVAAVPIYELIITDYPHSADANEATLGLARCLTLLDRPGDAQELLLGFLENSTGEYTSRALLMLAMDSQDQGDLVGAQRTLQRLVSVTPPESRWREIGERLLREIESELREAPRMLNRHVRASLKAAATTLGQRLLAMLAAVIALIGLSRLYHPAETIMVLRRNWTIPRVTVLFVGVWLFVAVWNVCTDLLVLRMVEDDVISLSTSFTLLRFRAIPAVLAAAIAVLWGERLAAIRFPQGRQLLVALSVVTLSAILLVAVWVTWANLTQGTTSDARDTPVGISVTVVGALYLLAIAVGEECLYRGALYQCCRNSVGTVGASVLTAGVFAAAHAYDAENTAYAFLFGLLAAWQLERFRTLLVPITFHWLMGFVIHVW